MLAITPQMRILVAVEAVDFRKGIDSLAELCRAKLHADPFSGCLFVFRSRRATSIKVLVYDGQGFWLATKRLSKGRFRWWPQGEEYGQAVRQFTEAYGLEKSAVSEHFIEASRAKLKAMMESRLDKLRLCALLIDATPFEGQQMVAALGIGQDGRKTILGIRQGATENATVVGELLGDLVSRGLDFTEPRLYVLAGGKALTAAVKKYAGESAAIQRCQVHKRRNVLDHLTDEQRPGVAKKLNAAYALEDHAAAKQALNVLHRELMDLNPSAARSLGKGMEETLTVHRLHVPMQLRKTLASTNVIESAFSIVERVCRNVKRWHGGDQRERWVGSGLLVAQKQFRRITGYKQIPALIRELEAQGPSKPEVVKRRKAS